MFLTLLQLGGLSYFEGDVAVTENIFLGVVCAYWLTERVSRQRKLISRALISIGFAPPRCALQASPILPNVAPLSRSYLSRTPAPQHHFF